MSTPIEPLRRLALTAALLATMLQFGCDVQSSSTPAAPPATYAVPTAAPQAILPTPVAPALTPAAVIPMPTLTTAPQASSLQPPALFPTSSSTLPFTGTLLIADAGNNRLLEVTLDRNIVWTFPVTGSLPATRTWRYPDDAFFSPDRTLISVNEESNHVISVIDYASRRLVWQFGQPGRPGSDLAHLNTPDDAHLLPDGTVVVADIKNCRVLIIPWDKQNVRSIGSPRNCSGRGPGSLAAPNGVTPLPNGHLLVTEIHTHRISEMDLEGNVTRAVTLPLAYPSDAFLTPRDTLIVADYTQPGQVIEVDWSGRVLWVFPPHGSKERLDRPSIAIELPNGNRVIVDDHHHRVIVADTQGNILWQYGVTGVPGRTPGLLYIPDGIDWKPS